MKAMSGAAELQRVFGVERSHILQLSENQFRIIVSDEWLTAVVSTGHLPPQCPSLNLPEVEIGAIMFQEKRHLPLGFTFVQVDILDKHEDLYVRKKPIPIPKKCATYKSIFEVLQSINETNFANLWTEANGDTSGETSIRLEDFESFTDRLAAVLDKLYNCRVITDCDSPKLSLKVPKDNEPLTAHAGIHPLWVVIETSAAFVLLSPYLPHSLVHLPCFSPAVMYRSPARGLFIAYQLAELLAFAAEAGLDIGELTLEDFRITDSLWILLCPRWNRGILKNAITAAEYEEFRSTCFRFLVEPSTGTELPLKEAMDAWLEGKLGNFEYLMLLNKLSGRCANNPYYHPVLPWVTDFSSPEGANFRDLSKSKFRLTRGDRQLDVTYESALSLAQQSMEVGGTMQQVDRALRVPHHISEILSDITYYVYKARRFSREVLCTHVRQKWVPAEYPASIQRLQEWSPNESIPEFFTDPSIFRSVHSDLPDLEIPSWAESPEDFTVKHMNILQSQYVAEHLHHWIDITFGYKLTGAAAIKAKNVSLPLVDNHTFLLAGGVSQLFTLPHPPRKRASANRPPKLSTSSVLRNPGLRHQRRGRSVHGRRTEGLPDSRLANRSFQEDQVILTSSVGTSASALFDQQLQSESQIAQQGGANRRLFRMSRSVSREPTTTRPESLSIHLPRDFQPFLKLGHIEAQFLFRQKQLLTVNDDLPSPSRKDQDLLPGKILKKLTENDRNRQRDDTLLLGCLLAELSLTPVFHAQSTKLPLLERAIFLRKAVLTAHPPRYLRGLVRSLLPPGGIFPPVGMDGLPPPRPSFLLCPHSSPARFPPAFARLYYFLATTQAQSLSNGLVFHRAEQNHISRISSHLPRLLAELNRESVELVLLHLSTLFRQADSCVLAIWQLFEPLARALGPKEAVDAFLKDLIRAFDPEVATAKHIKLYHRSFILQLMVRLGLQAFLQHFATVLVEAVGGYRDFEELDSNSNSTLNGLMGERGAGNYHQHASGGARSALLANVNSNLNLSHATHAAGTTAHRCKLTKKQSHLDSTELEELESTLASVRSHPDKDKQAKSIVVPEAGVAKGIGSSTDCRNEQGGSEEHEDLTEGTDLRAEEIFMFEAEDSDLTDNQQENTSSLPREKPSTIIEANFTDDLPPSGSASAAFSLETMTNGTDATPCQNSAVSVSAQPVSSTSFKRTIPLKDINCSSYNISDVASESIVWLAHRLGPVLTARHLTRNLLRMLTLCYSGSDQMEFTEPLYKDHSDYVVNLSQTYILGDVAAMKAFSTLCDIAFLYGEHFITLQYMQHVADLVELCRKHVTETLEGSLLGGITLLKHVLPLLTDATLMNHLQTTIIRNIIYPSIQLVSSLHHSFPNGAHSRRLITYRIADVLHLISLRIGFEMSRQHLSTVLRRFFVSFERAFCDKNQLDAVEHLTPLEKSIDKASGAQSFGLTQSMDDYLDIKKDSPSQEYRIGTPVKISSVLVSRALPFQASPPLETTQSGDSELRQRALAEIRLVFDAEMAQVTYIPFCKQIGGIYMAETILGAHNDLVRRLCLREEDGAHGGPAGAPGRDGHRRNPSYGHDESFVSSEFGKNVAIMGNRIDVQMEASYNEDDSRNVTHGPPNLGGGVGGPLSVGRYDMNLLRRKMANIQRHLKGNWLSYWEHEVGQDPKNTSKLDFKQIKLQTFVGHTAGIRQITALDNENSFLSASKDKTVKLWSLRNSGSDAVGCNAQWTYTLHRKSVFAVHFLDSHRVVGSCDGSVHIWDPFLGSSVRTLDQMRHAPVTAFAVLSAPSSCFLAATVHGLIKVLDARCGEYQHDFKTSVGGSGNIRCITAGPENQWVAIGHSSGMVSVLDLRSGIVMGTWNAHEGEILQIKALTGGLFATSGLDQTVSVWNADEAKLRCHLKGIADPTICIARHQKELVTGTTSNRVTIHSLLEGSQHATSVKLRTDSFRGMLTSLAVLPLNRLLLLGADNGVISLYC